MGPSLTTEGAKTLEAGAGKSQFQSTIKVHHSGLKKRLCQPS